MATVVERIQEFNKDLLEDKIELKYLFMTENLFRFSRGTCHLFYEDWSKVAAGIPSPPVWICGDLHLENFGSYKAKNRLVYFDLNDFDEAILAPATWEVVRTVSSILIAFHTLKIEQKKALRMAEQFLKTYSRTLADGITRYIEPRTAKGIVAEFLSAVEKRKYKELLQKKVRKTKAKIRLKESHPKHLILDKELKARLFKNIEEWIKLNSDGPYNYKLIDGVFRIAGTGSVGLKRYAFLLKSKNKNEKYLLLDMKQVRPSSLAPYVTIPQPRFETEAERVIAIQKRMQNVTPDLLSVSKFDGDLYLLQEMQPVEDNIDFNLIKNKYRDIYQVIDDMGILTASAQLRSSGRDGSAIADELIAFGRGDTWHAPVINYAVDYLKQIQEDYKEFISWRKSFPQKQATLNSNQ